MLKTLSLVGWVVAGLLGALLYSEWTANGLSFRHLRTMVESQHAEAEKGGARSNSRLGADGQDQRLSNEYQPDCSKREDADLCAQRRMAAAAEEQTGLNKWGLLLLFFTFAATTAAAFYARHAALASRKTVGIMEDTAKRQLRAYLSVEPHGINPISSKDDVIGHIGIRNTGKVPAKKAAWFVDVKFSSDGRLADFPTDRLPAKGSAVVFPGTEIRRGSRTASIEQEIANFEGGGLFIYVWGVVFYEDDFGESRFTKFCHRYNNEVLLRDAQGGIIGISSEHARHHEHGNDAT